MNEKILPTFSISGIKRIAMCAEKKPAVAWPALRSRETSSREHDTPGVVAGIDAQC